MYKYLASLRFAAAAPWNAAASAVAATNTSTEARRELTLAKDEPIWGGGMVERP